MSRRDDDYDNFYPPYVPVAERKAKTARQAKKLAAGNPKLRPIAADGRKLGRTFWGKAWCDNVESYHDYANRLPRGRSYLRHGAVLDLQVEPGEVTALVAGSSGRPYRIRIAIEPLDRTRWENLKKRCAGKIGSLLALAQGKLPPELLRDFCDRKIGLFPSPAEIRCKCSCPDWAELCKHLAAVLYGIGVRLDEEPRLFFTLRGVDEAELVGAEALESLTEGVAAEIAPEELSAIFGVEFDVPDVAAPTPPPDAAPAAVAPPPFCGWTPARLAEWRGSLRLSQAALGRQLGVTAASVSNWERGKTPISPALSTRLDQLAQPAGAAEFTLDEIARLRCRLKLTRAQFARRLGVSQMTVRNWETGRSRPRAVHRQALSRLA